MLQQKLFLLLLLRLTRCYNKLFMVNVIVNYDKFANKIWKKITHFETNLIFFNLNLRRTVAQISYWNEWISSCWLIFWLFFPLPLWAKRASREVANLTERKKNLHSPVYGVKYYFTLFCHPLRDPKLIKKKTHPPSFWILFTHISEGSNMKKMKSSPKII